MAITEMKDSTCNSAGVLPVTARTAAASGAAAWSAYGTVEIIFAVILRRALFPATFIPPHDGFTVALLLIYPVSGALLMLACYAIAPQLATRSTAAAIVAVIVAANCIAAGPWVAAAIPAAIAVGVVSSTVAGVRAITQTWAVAFLMLAPLFAAKELGFQQNRSTKAAAATAAIFLVLMVSRLLVHRVNHNAPRATFLIFIVATAAAMVVETPKPRSLKPLPTRIDSSLPNVVLIVMDTVRADHMSLYGYARDTTPQLRTLAREASVYRNAYAPSNMTLPTHASIFTGLYGSEHGAHYDEGWVVGRPLSSSAITLAEVLSARGYATASIAANYVYLGTEFGLDQGFQLLDARPPRMIFGAPWNHYIRYRIATWADSLLGLPERTRLLARPAEEINRSAESYISAAARKRRPFFLFLNYMDAHAPCIPPPPFDSLFPGRDPVHDTGLADRLQVDMAAGRLFVTPEQRNDLIARYDGAIAHVDHAIGNVVSSLKRTGLFDRTILIVTSDHGESFGEHGVIGHGTTNYEDQVRVPLLIRDPRQSGGRIFEHEVSLLEIWRLLTLSTRAPYPVVMESFPFRGPASTQTFRRSGTAIVHERVKWIDNLDGADELFRLGDDPNERENLAESMPVHTAALRRALNDWRAGLHLATRGGESSLDAETVRRLRSLGYIH